MLLTMVAVKGMLSIREEARAETHITKIMAMAKRWSSGTAWEGKEGEEQLLYVPHLLPLRCKWPTSDLNQTCCFFFTDWLFEASWRGLFTCPLPVSARKRFLSVVCCLGKHEQVKPGLTHLLSRVIISRTKAHRPNTGWHIYYCSSPAQKTGKSQKAEWNQTQGQFPQIRICRINGCVQTGNMVSPVPEFKW